MKSSLLFKGIQILFLTILLLSWSTAPAQADCGTLGASSGSVVGATTTLPNVFQDTGAQTTVNLGAGTGDVLVVSSFTSRSSQNSITGSWRISSPTAGDSLQVDRQISSNSDNGIGSVVYRAENITGSHTFELQHRTDSSSRQAVTNGTIVAIPLLTSGAVALNNGFVSTAASHSYTLSPYVPVPGSNTSVVLPVAGDIYIVAGFNSSSGIGQTTSGEWKLQYRPQSGTWTDLGRPSRRLHSGSSDIGVVSLTALAKNQPANTYEVRLAVSAVNNRNIDTFNLSMAAVALAYDGGGTPGYFPAFQVDAASYSINPAGTRQIVLENESAISAESGAQAFMGAQFQMDGVSGSTVFSFDLAIDNGSTLDSLDQNRLLANSGDIGNGGSIALSASLPSGTNPAFQFRAEADRIPASLTNPVLVVIGMTCRDSYAPTAITLFDLKAHSPDQTNTLSVFAAGLFLLLIIFGTWKSAHAGFYKR